VNKRPPLIGIVGWKNSGKTTLVERLVAMLSARGLKVATVKHAHHALRMPDGTTDGERHARAGAVETVVLAPDAWERSGKRQAGPAPSLDDVATRLGHVDLVLVEGFKRAAIPKIEVWRRASQTKEALAPSDTNVVAVAADHVVDAGGLPLFDLDDAEGIAGFIEELIAATKKT
jgi:molybdopterin-guanine dinucleotide biosynthesis protein B